MPATAKIPYAVWVLDPYCDECHTQEEVSKWASSDGLRRCWRCRNKRDDLKRFARMAQEPKPLDDLKREKQQRQEVARALNLTEHEYVIYQRLVASGAKVFRSGWPDFLVQDASGNFRFVEVKTDTDVLRPAQIKMHEALRKAGITVEIVFE